MIGTFNGPHRFLSNFTDATVVLDGILYQSVEHAFQAAKTLHAVERERVRMQPTASKAKRAGQRVTMRADWEAIKVDVMRELLRQKFAKFPFRTWLLETGTQELVEGNTWNDTFWGVCQGVGQNWLGKLLMDVRTELQEQET